MRDTDTTPGTGPGDTARAAAARTTWRIAPATARVEFTIRKRLLFLLPLTVTGRFADVSGTIAVDERDPATAEAEVIIDAASVQSGNARRDKHLHSADFFDVERHPRLTFRSRRVTAIDREAGRYRITGDLTVRGVTREVTLDATYTPAPIGAGDRRAALTLAGALNRRDFGLGWTRPHINVADELTVALAVEALPA